ncbi:TerC family protein [Parafilimonas terrae]|uniref:Membrane protein TerC, possibly involved in tellurium resistance n=1 Tax=Parafilimonas terrae TaxID=1465490 RepID=A0A1I5RDF0_9BACT|nr:TerC family protein [Parafilimonas terrae]SFP56608.1 Membrane protein TerC, possibly involved in tellurium resistance [Parafilimonas terrae]
MEDIIALLTLILLEVVLGIDNIIFISIVTGRLPLQQQKKARRLGLLLAMLMRLVLLTLISLILKLQGNLFTVFDIDISGKDIILILGGLFLLYKSATEIHHKTDGGPEEVSTKKATNFSGAIGQIIMLDIVFSIDSIVTAIGMVDHLWIMYAAVVISVTVMLFAAEPISRFIHKYPSFKILALSFLLLIGISLIGEGLDFHIPKGYIYFSVAFALLVNIFQLRLEKRKP